jgi:hypothetical protein
MYPKKTVNPKDQLDDPFAYIRNKEKADDVVNKAIEKFFGANPAIYGNSGLNE